MTSLGEFGAAIGRDNRELVRRFFERNPYATQGECAAHTGLSKVAVGRHVKVLKAEHAASQKALVNG